MIFGLFILFAARGRDEIRAANMGTPHQTDNWVLERKNHFLKAGNLNNKMKGNETIKKNKKQPSAV